MSLVAYDSFTRTISSALGTADVGGAWTINTNTFDCNGTQGMSDTVAGSTRRARLASVSSLNQDYKLRIKTDKVAAGGYQQFILTLRQLDQDANYYEVLVKFTTAQAVTIQLSRRIASSSFVIGSETTVSGLTHAADTFIRVRAQALGASPTTLRAKAWADGSAEPSAWTISASDSTAALQVASHLGIRWFNEATSSQGTVTAYFDDLTVTTGSTPSQGLILDG